MKIYFFINKISKYTNTMVLKIILNIKYIFCDLKLATYQ